MRKEKVNILVFGLLSTGSSALVDLFREYDNINVIPGEFDDFRAPCLVADQLSQVSSKDFPNKIDNLTGLKNRITLFYNIFPIFKWKLSLIRGIRGKFISSVIRIRQLNLLKRLNRILKSNISYGAKIKFANKWINEIGNINSKNKEFVVFNQPLLTGNDTQIWKDVFSPFKLICVYRDPKDQFADIIKNGRLHLPFGAPKVNLAGVIIEQIYGRNRKGAIDLHIDAMKKRLEWVDSMRIELEPDNFLLIDFEGFVKNYNQYKTVIENFIGNNKEHHERIKAFFNPLNAIKSIGIYKEYLTLAEIDSLSELGKWYEDMIQRNSKYYN